MLYEKLTQLRKQAGYTQAHLARILGIPRPTYSNYERPKEMSGREPSVEILKRLADVYDISLDYLLDRTKDPFSNKTWQAIDMRKMLNLNLHWDGVPLSHRELEPITKLLDIIAEDRLSRAENKHQSDDKTLDEVDKDMDKRLGDFLN